MNLEWLKKFDNKKIVLLGFGLEGKSTYKCLKTYCSQCDIQVMDRNVSHVAAYFEDALDQPIIYDEDQYLCLDQGVDYVFKSPGIPLRDLEGHMDLSLVTSQSNEFIQAYGSKIIGVTGTKGKSTTVSFLSELLSRYDLQVELVGNIGLPAFDRIEPDKDMPLFIYELSSHQLETVKASPKYAVVLNLFEEHLDHYKSYDHYAEAKMNIARWQKPDDYFVYGGPGKEIAKRTAGFKGLKLPMTRAELGRGIHLEDEHVTIILEGQSLLLKDRDLGLVKGHHFLQNMSVGVLISMLLGYRDDQVIKACLRTFQGLSHRLSYVGQKGGVDYYNDSIATIPQATIAGIKAIANTETIIVGGMDRGIDYSLLLNYIEANPKFNWVMLPDSGHVLAKKLGPKDNVTCVNDLEEGVKLCSEITTPGNACILSPAAASYGFYKNFEDRGHQFEALVRALDSD